MYLEGYARPECKKHFTFDNGVFVIAAYLLPNTIYQYLMQGCVVNAVHGRGTITTTAYSMSEQNIHQLVLRLGMISIHVNPLGKALLRFSCHNHARYQALSPLA